MDLFEDDTFETKKLENCTRGFNASCNVGYEIAIKSLNTTGNMLTDIMKCNGNEKCAVDNPEEICYDLEYQCKYSKYLCNFTYIIYNDNIIGNI